MLFLIPALAAPTASALDDLVARLQTSPSPTEVCAAPLLGRVRLGCDGLLKALSQSELTPGRRTVTDEEALIELWMEREGSRFPITLVARATPAGWRFVDGTDGDGPALETQLSLDGSVDPNPVVLNKAVEAFLAQLHDPKVSETKGCKRALDPDACAELFGETRRQSLHFRPTGQQEQAEKLWVLTLVEQGGRPVDEARLGFAKSGKRWVFASIDEKPLPR